MTSTIDVRVTASPDDGTVVTITSESRHSAPLISYCSSAKYADGETGLVYYGYRYLKEARWLSRDPIGESGFELMGRRLGRVRRGDGNLYQLVQNNPLNLFDVLGLYNYIWEGNFSDLEKQAIKDSIGRVKDRAKVVIKQVEDNIKAMKVCLPCPAYDDLIKHLEHLKKVLQGMVKNIEDPGFKLEMYVETEGDEPGYSVSQHWWQNDQLYIPPAWFNLAIITHNTDPSQDKSMFHEISHSQGTKDGVADNYNDAHAIERLMQEDKEVWPPFVLDKKNADKKCKPGNK